MLALDLDRGRGDVDHQAAALGELLERAGARWLADASPSGGRHIFVLFAAALPWRELRDLCRSLALRFPAIDTAPMASLGGQISPPGSRHKSGGWRLLSSPEAASAAVEHPNGPEVWAALLAELAAELRQIERGTESRDLVADEAELDDAGVPWVPRLGGRLAPSSSRSPAPDGGTGPATQAAARPGWPSWVRLRPVAGSWPMSGRRSPPEPGRA